MKEERFRTIKKKIIKIVGLNSILLFTFSKNIYGSQENIILTGDMNLSSTRSKVLMVSVILLVLIVYIILKIVIKDIKRKLRLRKKRKIQNKLKKADEKRQAKEKKGLEKAALENEKRLNKGKMPKESPEETKTETLPVDQLSTLEPESPEVQTSNDFINILADSQSPRVSLDPTKSKEDEEFLNLLTGESNADRPVEVAPTEETTLEKDEAALVGNIKENISNVVEVEIPKGSEVLLIKETDGPQELDIKYIKKQGSIYIDIDDAINISDKRAENYAEYFQEQEPVKRMVIRRPSSIKTETIEINTNFDEEFSFKEVNDKKRKIRNRVLDRSNRLFNIEKIYLDDKNNVQETGKKSANDLAEQESQTSKLLEEMGLAKAIEDNPLNIPQDLKKVLVEDIQGPEKKEIVSISNSPLKEPESVHLVLEIDEEPIVKPEEKKEQEFTVENDFKGFWE